MKSFYLFLLLAIICTADGQFRSKKALPECNARNKGQWVHPARRRVSLIADSIALGDLFTSIWKQVRMHAFFRTRILDPKTMVKADFNNVPLDSVLSQLLRQRGLQWTYFDEVFVITEQETTDSMKSEGKSTVTLQAVQDSAEDQSWLMSRVACGRQSGKEADNEKVWIRQPGISEVISFEQRIGSGLKFVEKAAYSDDFPIQKRYPISLTPLTAERWEEKGHLPVYAEYYYTPGDSLVRVISYAWQRFYDSNYTEDQEEQIEQEAKKIQMEEDAKLNFYKSEFERIKTLLIFKFGPPSDSAARELTWDKSKFYGQLRFVFNPYAHTIKFKLWWK